MEAHKDEHPILKMCNVLGVSSSGYYKWQSKHCRGETDREKRKNELKQKIKKSFHESLGTYGSPRVHDDLIEWGYTVSQKTVARYMHEMGLKATPEVKYVVTTDSNHDLAIYPNLVKRNFNVDSPNTVWVADITYVRTLEGWMYLASIMDLFSRKIIGWSLGPSMKKELTLAALEMAKTTRRPPEGLIHHSDRGTQYCSKNYTEALQEAGIEISMSKKGDPYDNACIESFHATIKKELIYRFRFNTRAEASRAINYYISSRYNERRKHSTLGYLSPNNFERNYHLSISEKIS
ncbi:IS3 family transposase [[Bacillus] enclensis]|nr:IS3 family transposase [[Bacillus] enclensis]